MHMRLVAFEGPTSVRTGDRLNLRGHVCMHRRLVAFKGPTSVENDHSIILFLLLARIILQCLLYLNVNTGGRFIHLCVYLLEQ